MGQVSWVERVKEGTWLLEVKKKELGRRQENKSRADAATQPDSLKW